MFNQQRPERAEEVAAQRRRRDGSGLTRSLNLEVPEDIRAKLAEEGRTPRWINDSKNRIADLTTRDDYDLVEGVEPVRVDTGPDGKPIFAYLVSKPDEFIAEDRNAADRKRRQVETARVTGKTIGPDGEAREIEGQGGARMYVDPASKITRNEVLDR